MFKWLRCKINKHAVVQGLIDEKRYYRDNVERIYEELNVKGIYIDPRELVTERHIMKAKEGSPLSVRNKNDFANDADVCCLLRQCFELRQLFFALCDYKFSATQPN